MNSSEVRERYLRFFETQGHKRLPSDSLVPSNDPTLLFTGAGMNQFKESFLGIGKLPWKRVTTSQKCLRVPDLENVGFTPRHHTFFEMLGNFSFGDYFKRDCIRWEWELFTQVYGFAKDRLWVTVYLDDDEAAEIWHKDVGLPLERIYRFGEKENFWPAEAPSKGPNGPCGPCSEIYFDQKPGGAPPKREGLGAMPDDRFLEVGNCVFTQFNRGDGEPGKGGKLSPLPQKNIDVGLGLERIVAVLQNAPNNFETDLFWPYLRALEKRSGRSYATASQDGVRMRRIADHVRAVTFCIGDGARPSNEGRGYVVRKILRRACRDLYELGIDEPALHSMVPLVVETMGAAYPELASSAPAIASFLGSEEKQFREIYVRGVDRLEELLDRTQNKTVSGADAFELHDTLGFPIDLTVQISEERGFKVDMVGFERAMEAQRDRARAGSSMAKEIFVEGPDSALRKELEERARKEGRPKIEHSTFTGYADSPTDYANRARFEVRDARIVGLIYRGLTPVTSVTVATEQGSSTHDQNLSQDSAGLHVRLPRNWNFEVVLDKTPFYAEGGGQVGDQGVLSIGKFVANVSKATRRGDFTFHESRIDEAVPLGTSIHVGDTVLASVNKPARLDTERHHTATHLLHLALKTILGEHVNQAGSLVSPERLRFDFTHGGKLTDEQIRQVEDFVNERILRGVVVGKREMSMDEAKREGAVMLFGEKYGDRVRVLTAADSVELCGGTHVGNTSDIGSLKIVSEASTAAGVRRIEAVSGDRVVQLRDEKKKLLEQIAKELGASAENAGLAMRQLRAEWKQAKDGKTSAAKPAAPAATPSASPASPRDPRVPAVVDELRRIESLLAEISVELKSPPASAVERIRQLRTEIAQKQDAGTKSASIDPEAAYAQVRSALTAASDGQAGVAVVPGFPAADLRSLVERLKKDHADFAVAILAPGEGDIAFVVAVQGAPSKRVKAGDVAKAIGPKLGGGGGGRPDFAQGQGKNVAGAGEAASVARAMLVG